MNVELVDCSFYLPGGKMKLSLSLKMFVASLKCIKMMLFISVILSKSKNNIFSKVLFSSTVPKIYVHVQILLFLAAAFAL